MATLHVKTPDGAYSSVDLETMNIESSLQQNGWCKLPNGLIIQWISDRSKFLVNSLIAVLDCVESSVTPVLCQYFMSIVHQKYEKSGMNFGFLGDKCDMIVTESGVN